MPTVSSWDNTQTVELAVHEIDIDTDHIFTVSEISVLNRTALEPSISPTYNDRKTSMDCNLNPSLVKCF